eukprot:2313279-Amphidinium_carterae.1
MAMPRSTQHSVKPKRLRLYDNLRCQCRKLAPELFQVEPRATQFAVSRNSVEQVDGKIAESLVSALLMSDRSHST